MQHTTQKFIRVVSAVIFTITNPLPYHTPAIVALMIHRLTAELPTYIINDTSK